MRAVRPIRTSWAGRWPTLASERELRRRYVEACTDDFDRPTNWPGWPGLMISRSRLRGVLVSGRALRQRRRLVAGLLLGCPSPANRRDWDRRQSDTAARRAGGRLAARGTALLQSPRGERPDDRHARDADAGTAACASTGPPSSWSRGSPSAGNRAPTAAPIRCTCARASSGPTGRRSRRPTCCSRCRRSTTRRSRASWPAASWSAASRLQATAPDAATVVLTYAAPSGPGVRLLDMLPILPRHKLEAALAAGTFAQAWDDGDRARRDRRHGPVRPARVSARAAAGLRSQPALLAHGAGRGCSCRTSIASCSRSCPSRTRSCCGCSPAPPT